MKKSDKIKDKLQSFTLSLDAFCMAYTSMLVFFFVPYCASVCGSLVIAFLPLVFIIPFALMPVVYALVHRFNPLLFGRYHLFMPLSAMVGALFFVMSFSAEVTAAPRASLPLCSLRFTPPPYTGDLPPVQLLRLHRSFQSRPTFRLCVPTFLMPWSTGISTCCPSTTSFDLALGPDLPRADQLYSGNLRYPADRILTYLSLLIPAFSLLNAPQLLPVLLRRIKNAPLPMILLSSHGFGVVFQPRTFSAQGLSTSELLRTL